MTHPPRTIRRCGVWIAVCAVVVVLASACGSSGSSGGTSGTKASLAVGYFTGLVAEPETVIGSVKTLESQVGSTVKWVPITAGATALAEMRAGAFDFVAGVGNPPTVAAIANGTPIDVVWAQSLDSDDLLVPASVTAPGALAGQTIGDLDGSSQDFELRGWLTATGLTDKVKVLGFASEQAAAAAYLAGKLAGVYVQGALDEQLQAKGAHSLTNAKQIADLGYPSLNVLTVAHSDITQYPATVQRYVCTELAATKDLFGPDNKTYFADSAALLGIPADQAVSATSKNLPYYIPPEQELHWLSNSGTDSPIVSSYVKTATFDQAQGRISNVPSAAVLASHINPTFAQNALAGKC